MPDPKIRDYFKSKKEAWLKEKLKNVEDENARNLIILQAEDKFNPNLWLPDAARRAGQIKISTHPCTFSHPSAEKSKNGKTTAIIAEKSRKNDGFLKTGNVDVRKDALGNAAALDVYGFLNTELEDGRSLIEHIETDSPIAKSLLNIPNHNYDELKEGFLAMIKNTDTETITSSKIKQVYFPVDSENYHLLSILSNSGIVFELRDRIDTLQFSDEQKELREKRRKNESSEDGYKEIYDLTSIGYGGANPQNVSVLNSKYRGRSKIFLSAPPALEKREIKFPKKDFFTESIRFYHVREPLQKLHSIFKSGLDSPIPRRNLESGRDNRIEEILDKIILRMALIRSISTEQNYEKTNELSEYQKTWLLEINKEKREVDDEWLKKLCLEITNWILKAYEKIIKKPVPLGAAEQQYIQEFIEINKEALR